MDLKNKRFCLGHLSLTSLDESSQGNPSERLTTYTKNIEERVEMLRQKRDFEKKLPLVEMNHKGRELEIVLVSSASRGLRFSEVVGLLERERVETTDGFHSIVGDTIVHKIRIEASPEKDYALLMDKLKALA